jgi:hypothetical protein
MTTSRGQLVALDRDQVQTAVASAVCAPSLLNSQPWRFRFDGEVLDVFAVPDRAPTLVDPHGREVFLSLGAALFNLRLALLAGGRVPSVQLLPTPLDPTHVAQVRIGGPGQLSALEKPLYEAIPNRRSNRLPFTAEPVPTELFLHLQDAAAAEGGWLDAATGAHRAVVLDILHEADHVQRSNPALVQEFARWTVARTRADVGIPATSLGPRPHHPSAAVRDLTLGASSPAANAFAAVSRPAALFEDAALLAVLLTTGDHPVDWLRGGLALQRVLLTATSLGVAVGLLSHGTEVADLRPLVRDTSSRWRHPQIVLRFGFSAASAAMSAYSPRLPLPEVLEFADP